MSGGEIACGSVFGVPTGIKANITSQLPNLHTVGINRRAEKSPGRVHSFSHMLLYVRIHFFKTWHADFSFHFANGQFP